MKKKTQRFTKYMNQDFILERDEIVEEKIIDIQLNGQSHFTNVCSPWDLDELALGVLLSAQLISPSTEIKAIIEEENFINIITDDKKQKRPLPQMEEERFKISSQQVFEASQKLEEEARLFQATGGVHSAALFGEDLISFKVDISRHNTLNRLLGQAFLEGESLTNKYLAYSGRIPSEIIEKVHQMGLKIIISPSAPTSLGIELAETYDITLIGFSRESRFSIYTHPHRIKDFNLL